MSTARTTAIASSSNDVELVSYPNVVSREAGERDPLLLRERIVPDDQITGLSKQRKSANVASYYKEQNRHIDRLLKPMAVHTAEGESDAADMALKVKIAVNVSFACNIALAAIQLYAAISSMSLALFATCVDAGECYRAHTAHADD